MSGKSFIKHALRTSVAALVAFGFAGAAQAVDVDPGDYTALPEGTNLALLYGIYTDRDQLQVPGVGTLDEGTRLKSAIGLARFVHFMKIGPFIVDPQIIIPFGTIYGGKVNGQRLDKSSGIGDIVPFATIWFVNKPDPNHGTYLGFSPIVTFPTGNYKAGKSVNIGGNRMTYDMQVGLIQGLGKGLTLDVYGDVIWYGDNDKYGAARQTLSQNTTASLQLWGRAALSPKTSVSLGYAGYWGGKQKVDDLYNGNKTENQQIRVALQTMVSKSIQLEGIAGRMVHVEGGFREAARFQIRVLKIF
ncbi:MAG: hypothetical protein A2095_03820 [Sphingomonadales bacterium GWF1_63_6]|nr:MAG: hypothetical protein A2095_03820 [Sphingomonadales bacterium GWF1_63_6]|tara:strand:- start:1456 stop:2361 length:906 start_codon:yes stop_codon:yes gene_type:complete